MSKLPVMHDEIVSYDQYSRGYTDGTQAEMERARQRQATAHTSTMKDADPFAKIVDALAAERKVKHADVGKDSAPNLVAQVTAAFKECDRQFVMDQELRELVTNYRAAKPKPRPKPVSRPMPRPYAIDEADLVSRSNSFYREKFRGGAK